MNKKVFAFCMAALLLTGCGSTAPAAGNSTVADQASQAAETKSEKTPEKEEKADSSEEFEYYDWDGIVMPIPAGMEEHVRSRMANLRCWCDGKDEEAVYYAFSSDFYIAPETLDELPEKIIKTCDNYFYYVFDSDTLGDYSKVTSDETSDEDFIGFPARRIKGTVTLNNGTKLNYIAHYAFLDFSGSGDKNTPSFWMSFTSSDSKDALDRMEKAAALPLTQAKLRSTD